MPKNLLFSFLLLLSGISINFVTAAGAQEDGQQKFAAIGDFKLENGDVIRSCRIGYRTFGKPNQDKSNIIVFTTWAGGQTAQLNLKAGDKGSFFDTSKYYIVAIDALSNGVSSSPSNSELQPRMNFPKFTMRDLVNSQHKFLTETLKIDHVKAVMGISMGGMQTFQWIFSYPDFMDKAIPVVGSPQLAPYDLLHWQTQIDAIMNDPNWQNGNYTKNPTREFEYEIGAIILTTPDDYNRRMTREQVFAEIEKSKSATGGFDANDKIRQTQAMMSIDATEKFGGSWEKAADSVKAKTLIIVGRFDHTVTPAPALKMANLLNAQTLILDSDCGHMAPSCEGGKVKTAIEDFLY